MSARWSSAVLALWRREVLKFVRDRGRIVGAMGQPVAFWLLLGLGFDRSFVAPTEDVGYMAFLFPGIVLLTVLFTALFSTISVVEERRSGFLQAAAIAPVSRSALLAGAVSGGVTLAMLEAVLFLAAAPLVGFSLSLTGSVLALAICAAASVAFTTLGLIFAWRIATTRAFHGIMNLVILPLWALSGAIFPVAGAHPALAWVMAVNPVTHLLDLLRFALTGSHAMSVASPWISVSASLAFVAGLVLVGIRIVATAPPPAD